MDTKYHPDETITDFKETQHVESTGNDFLYNYHRGKLALGFVLFELMML